MKSSSYLSSSYLGSSVIQNFIRHFGLNRCRDELSYGWGQEFGPSFQRSLVTANERRDERPQNSPIMHFDTTPTQSHL